MVDRSLPPFFSPFLSFFPPHVGEFIRSRVIKRPTHFRNSCAIEIPRQMTSLRWGILLVLLCANQPASTHNIVDLIQTIRNKNVDENRSKDSLVTEFRDVIQTIQDHLYNTSMPGEYTSRRTPRMRVLPVAFSMSAWLSIFRRVVLFALPAQINLVICVTTLCRETQFIIGILRDNRGAGVRRGEAIETVACQPGIYRFIRERCGTMALA